MIDPSLLDAVTAWRADDPDDATRAELDALVAAGDEIALRERFASELVFGTAGLRGPLGAGPNRMNRVVVRRTAAAFGRWLDAIEASGPVVVGRDARHGSDAFAADTARVLAAMGRRVLCFADPVPTPLVAFAARDLGAAGAVVVTASHNPPADNGYKVYADGGRQILPDQAAAISGRAATLGRIGHIALAGETDEKIGYVAPGVVGRYLDGVAALRCALDVDGVAVAYTPLHGVGRDLMVAAFDRCGYPAPVVVAQQADPDPDFPTVAFPNPEEPGAMDAVVETAIDSGLSVAIANDPDADRFAVAVDGPGGWRQLNGDEVGVLLADHLLSHGSGSNRLVATTVVSSTMLSAIAAAHGVQYRETLTGFKWLAAAAEENDTLDFVLGYEEALGYSIGGLVADKDGISAAVVFAELVGSLARRGTTVIDRLEELDRQHGVHATRQVSIGFDGLGGAARMASAVERMRTGPPARLGDVAINEIEDLAPGGRLPPTDAVIVRGEGLRVVIRPSGTEPKLKIYLEAIAAPGGDVAASRRRVESLLASVVDEMGAFVA